jgi:hypothetical protein
MRSQCSVSPALARSSEPLFAYSGAARSSHGVSLVEARHGESRVHVGVQSSSPFESSERSAGQERWTRYAAHFQEKDRASRPRALKSRGRIGQSGRLPGFARHFHPCRRSGSPGELASLVRIGSPSSRARCTKSTSCIPSILLAASNAACSKRSAVVSSPPARRRRAARRRPRSSPGYRSTPAAP